MISSLKKKVLNFERKFEVRPEDRQYWVLIRREPHAFADMIPMALSSIVQGPPSEKAYCSIMTGKAYGPFNTREEAEAYRIQELKKLKTDQPERFKHLEELANFIKWPEKYEKYRQPIIPEEVRK